MKNNKCPCENCITLDICQERAEDDRSLRIFRKNTKCKFLANYLVQYEGTAKYARLHRAEKVLGI